MLLDQPFIGAIHGRDIGTGLQPERGVSRWIPAHRKDGLIYLATM
jgi:hypothetical protein